jgi:AraC-like DNA-binding protein
MNTLYREITPLSPDDCFTVFSRIKSGFDFPLHCHEEYELNYITHGKGAKRIVGYHMGEIDDPELVFIGGNLPHAWYTHHCKSKDIHEITVQFHKDLFDEKLLGRNQLSSIKSLLQRSCQGILFSQETIFKIKPRLESLKNRKGFDSVLELMAVLQELSVSDDMHILSPATPLDKHPDTKSRRLEKVFEFIRLNYASEMSLKDVADMVNMPEVSFSRFFKKRTGRTFIESLNDIRIGHATRKLINSTQTIAEISYRCGFNNLSYFNRMFKRKNGCTPSEFRENYVDSKIYI